MSLRLAAVDAGVLAAIRESPTALVSRLGALLGPAAAAVRQALEQSCILGGKTVRPCLGLLPGCR